MAFYLIGCINDKNEGVVIFGLGPPQLGPGPMFRGDIAPPKMNVKFKDKYEMPTIADRSKVTMWNATTTSIAHMYHDPAAGSGGQVEYWYVRTMETCKDSGVASWDVVNGSSYDMLMDKNGHVTGLRRVSS